MIITKLEFLNRFTTTETATILAASDSIPAIRVYLFKLQLAENLDLCNAETQAGVNALEAAGLLGAGRAAEILTIPKVRILPPYDTVWPDVYNVISVEGSTYHLETAGDFDASFVELV